MIIPTVLSEGMLTVKNLKFYQPYQIEYKELDINTIQVDVTGKGVLNYFEKLTPELEIQIHTNILKALKCYSDTTGHNSSEIGYHLELIPTKKLNQTFNCFESQIKLAIIYKKPVDGASAYSLHPTTKLITASILAEIFITND